MTKAFEPKRFLMTMRGGREYLTAAGRILWFRSEHPAGLIETKIISREPTIVIKALVYVNGQLIATGHGTAKAKGNEVWADRQIEKAETAAIARALGVAGYGTQFVEEFEDDDHLADTPLPPSPARSPFAEPPENRTKTALPAAQPASGVFSTQEAATEFLTALQPSFAGKTLAQIGHHVAGLLHVKRLSEYRGTLEQAQKLVATDLLARTATELGGVVQHEVTF